MCRVLLSARVHPGLVLLVMLSVFAPLAALGQSDSEVAMNHGLQREPLRAEPEPEVKPGSEETGDLLMARRQYAAAIAAYRQDASTNSAVYWNKLGIAYHHLFAITEAKHDYARAIQLNPKYAEAINNMGAVLYAQKDYKRAERFYKRALKLTPDSAVSYSNLGTVFIAQRKYKQGAQAYERAFGLDPRIFDANYGGKVEEETPTRERAKLDFYLAETFAKAGMKQEADGRQGAGYAARNAGVPCADGRASVS